MFRDLDPEIQAQTVLTYLLVAAAPDKEPPSMKELERRLGISSSSVSRNVAALSEMHRLGKPGHDLVEAYEDPMDRRNKLVRLTPKGRTLALRLADLMGAK